MKLKRSKKILIIILMIVVAIFAFCYNANIVEAAINKDYYEPDPVTDATLEDAVKSSSLLEALARLIYALGQFIEWIMATIFKMITGKGTSDFPWADKIVFNAVPILDVNFINPASGSFLLELQSVIKNIYSTVLAIAVSFFGITVMLTAIRLIISTIASEKAKYKQAIVDWAVGFVMLFCIHFFISFIFYLNEQLVVVASKMVTARLNVANATAQVEQGELASKLIDSMGSSTYKGKKIKTILTENKNILSTYLTLSSKDSSKGLQEMLMKTTSYWGVDTNINDEQQRQYLAMIILWAAEENVSLERIKEIRNKELLAVKDFGFLDPFPTYAQGLTDKNVTKIFGSHTKEIENATDYIRSYKKKLTLLESNNSTREYEKSINGNEIIWYSAGVNSIIDTNWFTAGWHNATTKFCEYKWSDVLEDLYQLKSASNTNTGKYVASSGKTTRLISDLAKYFKQNAAEKTFRTTNITGLKDTGNINIQNMIMYAILVAQSLILFIAYIKRLFYVVMLAMFAPVVVVFEFFQKFGGGKGGAFNSWLKEFTTLVFTQTIQAFIYAIVISIILYGMSPNNNVSANDNNSALGLMSVFALLSVFKVEQMAKKIFGIGDTKAAPGGAMRSIAKTAFAVQLGKRVLNNVGKVTSGIGAISKSRKDNKKTAERLNEDMKDNGFEYNAKTKTAKRTVGSAGGSAGGGAGGSAGGGAGGSFGGDIENEKQMSDAAQRRVRNALRNYEDKASEIKKARNEGIKSIVAGFAESGGALMGAGMGGILASADGNLEEMLQGIVAGAGVGDAVGEGTVKALDSALKTVQKAYNHKSGISNKELNNIISSYKKSAEKTKVTFNSKDVGDI